MAPSTPHPDSRRPIDALDFDANRVTAAPARLYHPPSQDGHGHRSLLDDDVSLINELAEAIVERDRQRMRREVKRVGSFVCAVLAGLCAGSIASFSLYGPRFLTDLHYTQYRVNAVSITAELALYLPVPFFGFICDRYSPTPLVLLATLLFGLGYFLAAFTYKSGPPSDAIEGGVGWPFPVMILAFVGVGSGTSAMYLSAVATCAKNFATATYRGLMLAVPIAAFGLSSSWQSQVGANLLYERQPDGTKGDVDVFRYFVFLASTLIGVGLLGVFGLRIVDEEVLIDRGVEELERSGLLEESDFFRPESVTTPRLSRKNSSTSRRSLGRLRSYGTVDRSNHGDAGADTDDDSLSSDPDLGLSLSESMLLKKMEDEERLRQKKIWLLNHATHTFLTDRTMWLLAAGFFLLTGPSEAYINNLGTIIPSLTPRHWLQPAHPPAGRASSHVSIIALTSTFARLFTGTLSDLVSPPAPPSSPTSASLSASTGISRLVLLLPSASLLVLCFLLLAMPAFVPSHPGLFLTASGLLGLGYGAAFSLVPIIISVVWDVENFATNWGIIAMMPAGGAAVWSLIYSAGYERAARRGGTGDGGECVGHACFDAWAAGCSASIVLAITLWAFAWRTWQRRNVHV